jgi:hypothetical protein
VRRLLYRGWRLKAITLAGTTIIVTTITTIIIVTTTITRVVALIAGKTSARPTFR